MANYPTGAELMKRAGNQPQEIDPYMDIDDDPYMEVDTIPNTENLLQKAIRQSRMGPFGGTSITAALPASGQEATDLGRVAGRQIPMTRGQGVGPAEMGPIGIGLNLAGINESSPMIQPPQTEYGKNLEMSADIAPWAGLGLGGATSLIKNIPNITKPFRTGPIKKDIKSIEDLIFKSKKSEIPIQEELSQLKEQGKMMSESLAEKAKTVAYRGAKAVKEQISRRFEEANARFGEELNKLSSTMKRSDFTDSILNAVDEIDDLNVQDRLIKRVNDILEGPVRGAPDILSPKEVQSEIKRVMSLVGNNSRIKTIINQKILDILPNTVKGLEKLKASHAPIYKIAKEAKALGKGALERVAKGTAIGDEIEDLSRTGERLGTSHVERAKKVAHQNKLQKAMFEQKRATAEKRLGAKRQEQEFLGAKFPELERKLSATLGRKKLAIGTLGASVGIPIVNKVLKKIFGD